MTGSDDWGKDPSVKMMRRVFRQMESAQAALLKDAGISPLDLRLRRWRDISRAAFERGWAALAKKGMSTDEGQLGVLYAHCLAETMRRDGVGTPPTKPGVDEKMKKLAEEVLL